MFKPSFHATLGTRDSNECEGGGFTAGIFTQCTTLPTFCYNVDKCVAYKVLSCARPNTWWLDSHVVMKVDPTS
jgi:hypothetical protein